MNHTDTFGAALTTAREQWPDAEAFVCEGERVTFAELELSVRKHASALSALGVTHGTHVGICMGNSLAWLTSFLAIGVLGAVSVPINTRFSAREIEFVLKRADVQVLLVNDRFLNIDFISLLRSIVADIDTALPDPKLPKLSTVVVVGDDVPRGALSYPEILRASLAYDPLPVSQDQLALIQFTSGTTSFPKGVMLSHANLVKNARAAAARIGVREGDRYFSIRPFFHVGGSTLSILVSLIAGACLLSAKRFSPADNLALMAREKCTLISGNDTIFLMLMNDPTFATIAPKLVLRGGWAAVSPAVMRDIADKLGAQEMVVAYGLSEASPNVAISDHNDTLHERIEGWMRVHDGVCVRIADRSHGSIVKAGTAGEIQVRGWNVCSGYYREPEQTTKSFTDDGWLRTGDLGVMNGRRQLRFSGRLKDIIRVGGENVAPIEVEDILNEHPCVKQAQAVGLPDTRLGEVVVAYVTLVENKELDPEDLRHWCRERLANFKVPRHIGILESFEPIGVTSSNKVQKKNLIEYAINELKSNTKP